MHPDAARTVFEDLLARLARDAGADPLGDAAPPDAAWRRFLARHGHRVRRGGGEALYALALAEPAGSPVRRDAEAWAARHPRPALERVGGTDSAARAACLATADALDAPGGVLARASPDGALVALTDGASLGVWSLATGRCVAHFEGEELRGLAFAPGGRRLAVGVGARVVVRDLAGGAPAVAFHGHQDAPLSAVAFLPDGRRVVSLDQGGTVILWDAATAAPLRQMRAHRGERALGWTYADAVAVEHRAGHVVVGEGGARFVTTGPTGGTLKVWDAATGRCVRALAGAFLLVPGGARALREVPRGATLVDLASGRDRATLDGLALRDVVPHPDGRRALWRRDDALAVVDLERGAVARTAPAPPGRVVAWLPGDGLRVVALRGGRLQAWDLDAGDVPPRGAALTHAVALSVDGRAALSAAFAPAAVEDAAARADDLAPVIVAWDLAAHASRALADAPPGEVVALALDPAGRRAGAVVGRDVAVWDRATGALVRSARPLSEADRVAFVPGRWPDVVGAAEATPEGASRWRRWSAETGGVVWDGSARACPEAQPAWTFTPDGRWLVGPRGDVWDLADGRRAWVAWGDGEDPSHPARCAVSPDGAWLAVAREELVTAAIDGDVASWMEGGARFGVWDLAARRCAATLHGHGAALARVLFAGRGRLASLDARGTARLWDLASGACLARSTLPGATELAAALGDGRHVAVALGGRLAAWDLVAGREVARWEADAVVTALGAAGDTLALGDAAGGVDLLRWRGAATTDDARPAPEVAPVADAVADGARAWRAAGGEPAPRASAWLATFPGGSDPVRVIALHPDGRRLVTCHEFGQCCVWDADTGRALGWFATAWGVAAARFLPGGALVVADGATTAVWDVDRGERAATLATARAEDVTDLARSPDGARVAEVRGGVATVLDAATGRALARFPGAARGAAFREDGTLSVWRGARAGAALVVWDPGAPGEGTRVRLPRPVLCALADGRVVLAAPRHALLVWSAGAVVATLAGHAAPVEAVAHHAGRDRLVTADRDGTVCVWDLGGGRLVRRLRRPSRGRAALEPDAGRATRPASSDDEETSGQRPVLALDADGRRLFVTDAEGTAVQAWDLDAARARWSRGAHSPVRALAVRDGVAVGLRADGVFVAHDLATGAPREAPRAVPREVTSAAFLPGGERALLVVEGRGDPGDEAPSFRVWSLARGRARVLERDTGVARAAPHPDGARAVAAGVGADGREQCYEVWSLGARAPGGPVARVGDRAGVSTAHAVLADGSLVVGYGDGTLSVWDLAAGEARATLWGGHGAPVAAIARAPDGTLVTGDAAGVLARWDLAAGRCLGRWRGHDGAVAALVADGARVVSAGADGEATAWDAARAAALARWRGPAALTACALAPGARVVVGDAAGRVVVLA